LPPSREILIVEDNPADVRLVREALRGLKPEITLRSAADGEAALRILRRQGEHAGVPRPRLILLDFNLPKSDSREVLREIKSDVALRAIPVAVLTTSDAEKDIQDAYDLHANCYLRKPVDLDGFLATIRAAADFWLNVAQQGSD
jgi:two-component system, chemotaxis family, response regulator Rcp1